MNSSRKRRTLVLACLALLSFVVILHWSNGGKASARATWEYKLADEALNERSLNQLGLEGWELVIRIPAESSRYGGYWIFKRPK
jgi:hypothetical protein